MRQPAKSVQDPQERARRRKLAFYVIAGLLALFVVKTIWQYFTEPPTSMTTSAAPAIKPRVDLTEGDVVYSESPNVVACPVKENVSKLHRMAEIGDKAAFSSLLLTQCRLLHDTSAKLYVEKIPIFSDDVCVRPQGEIDCVWVFRGSLVKQPPG
ncbi:MAG: hypothetical protein FWD08_00260 [Alphaproteobacteria bacterium]|nr:hypothetical protein [Alphaproteobacteria bacterium]